MNQENNRRIRKQRKRNLYEPGKLSKLGEPSQVKQIDKVHQINWVQFALEVHQPWKAHVFNMNWAGKPGKQRTTIESNWKKWASWNQWPLDHVDEQVNQA